MIREGVTANQSPFRPGSKLGRYRIVSRLASGGMAEVWLAESQGPSGFLKRVALKTMLPSVAASPDFVKMFIHEASVAAQLAHENIVQVFDFGELEGHYFMAMEYVQGRSLRQIGRRSREIGRPVDVWFLTRTMIEVCKALQYVHTFGQSYDSSLGLVHRDVSPENVLVSFTGAVKLVDFGVTSATVGPALAEPGMIVGKCRYMAPERVRDPQGVPESDLFSIGVILYEYATGCVPFAGDDEGMILARVLEGRPRPPRQLVPSLPEDIERVILKAIQRDPEARHASAAELAQDLRAFLERHDASALHRPLDAKMGQLFADATEVPSYVRVAATRAAKASDTIIDVVIEELSADAIEMIEEVEASQSPSPVPPPPPTARDGEPDRSSNPVSQTRIQAQPPARGLEDLFSSSPRSERSSSAFPAAIPAEPAPPPTPRSSSLFGDEPARPVSAPPPSSRDLFSTGRPPEFHATDVFGAALPLVRDEVSFVLRDWGLSSPSSSPPANAPASRGEEPPGWGGMHAPAQHSSARASGAEAFARGLRHISAKDYVAALAAFREAVEAAPENRTYRTNLKRLEEKLERETR